MASGRTLGGGSEGCQARKAAETRASPALSCRMRSARRAPGLAHGRGRCEVDRNELTDPPLRHGHAVETVHSSHCHAVMGDDQEAGFAFRRHFLEQPADPVDIGIVQRGVDLVEDANRARIAPEGGEHQRQRRQRPFAA